MKKVTMKPISIYVPITRIDEDKRIVEGVAFANEIVEGEGGIRLRASAMKDATADYMKFGTVRSMHQPKAAGTAVPNDPEIAALCGVQWDVQDGRDIAYLRSYISDDSDWQKVKDGTYKGYSVGVAPKVMRGKTVESCTWYETSLVDRPKDPQALFTTFRVDGMPEEVEVQVQDDRLSTLTAELQRIETATGYSDIQRAELHGMITGAISEAEWQAYIERSDWDKEARDNLPEEDFGWPEEKKYPIADQEDMDAATKLVGRAPEDEQDKIKARLRKIAKRKDLKLPETWEEEDTKEEKERTVTPALVRASFAEYLDSMGQSDLCQTASRYLMMSLYDIQSPYGSDPMTPEAKEAAVRETCDQFKNFMVGVIASGKLPNIMDSERAAVPTITRAIIEDSLLATDELVVSRIAWDTAQETISRIAGLEEQVSSNEADISRVQGLLSVAEGEIKRLRELPSRPPPVTRTFTTTQKLFGTEVPNPDAAVIATLRRRKVELETSTPGDTKESESQATELLRIEHQLSKLGA